MENPVVNVDDVLGGFDELWSPRVVATMNEYALKVAKVQGDYVWHAHQDTDELFLVVSGTLHIDLRGADGPSRVTLGPRDVHVVPRGVEHCPSSPDGAAILMIEPRSTLSTGDYGGEIPAHITSSTGIV